MLTQVPAEQKSFLTFNGFFTNISVRLPSNQKINDKFLLQADNGNNSIFNNNNPSQNNNNPDTLIYNNININKNNNN